MDFEEIFSGFLIALGAGALIGLQRQQSRGGEKGPGVGGVRTFPLIALAGALSAFLAQTMGMWPLLGTMLVVGA
ncbi:MAG: MgtC/SapB family protein, partial [Nitrospirota bacterium]|nr:MgtC/SapB family protein [Nitrospirota bacterium]